MPFRFVGTVPQATPYCLWGGMDGELNALYLSTGGRQGGQSTIFRHLDAQPDGAWREETVPSGAETIAKMRDDGVRIFAFFETGGPHFIISRALDGDDTWTGEADLPGDDFVGGRGLHIQPGFILFAGGSAGWNVGSGFLRQGQMYAGPHGGPFDLLREPTPPSILWECERDPEGVVWEFWHGLEGNDGPVTYRAGEIIASPFPDLSSAIWWNGAMYACNGTIGEVRNQVARYDPDTDTWNTVLEMSVASKSQHVINVPRGAGEFWVAGQDPLQVYHSFDGETFEEHTELPALNTGPDDNCTVAIGYFKGRVWLAAQDFEADPSVIRLWVDRPGRDLQLQVI
jgi:hypothetical protein